MNDKEKLETLKAETMETPPPPEDDFFSSGSKPSKKAGTQFRKSRLMKLVLSGIIAGIGIFFIMALGKGCNNNHIKKNSYQQTESTPQVVTQTSIAAAIQNSQPKEDVVVQQTNSARLVAKKKERSFKSEIAAYLYTEKPEEKNYPSLKVEQIKSMGLPSGTKVPALLEDKVFSFNVAAPVLAIVARDFKWKDKTVIPKGSKFLGEASVLKSIDRINVNFELLIFPDGTEKRVKAMALADDGASGIKGKVDKHGDTKFLKAIGETLLAGASLFVGGINGDAYSLEDQLRSNLAQNLTNQAGQDLKSVKVDESISVEASTPIQVMLLETL